MFPHLGRAYADDLESSSFRSHRLLRLLLLFPHVGYPCDLAEGPENRVALKKTMELRKPVYVTYELDFELWLQGL